MDKVDIDEELHEMFDEGPKNKIFDSRTIREPIRQLGMTKPIVVETGSPVSEAIRLMKDNSVGCVLVQRKGYLTGIFTERDLLTKLTGTVKDLKTISIDEVMTPDPEVLQPDDTIAFALHMMAVGGYRHVPIVDGENRPVAIVSIRGIVEFLVEMFPDEVLNLPRRPLRKAGEREGA
ncbi:MAG: CBS domain-containing protein [Bacteroidota bacterium]